jgi:hypothetical protein
MQTSEVSTRRPIPFELLAGSVVALALHLAQIAQELESQIRDLPARPEGSMTWTPVAASHHDIVYEFRLRHSPPSRPRDDTSTF